MDIVPSITATSPLNMATHTAEVNTSIIQINTNFNITALYLPTYSRITADVTNATVTYATTGLSFLVVNAAEYEFKFNVTFQGTSTSGTVDFELIGPTYTFLSATLLTPSAYPRTFTATATALTCVVATAATNQVAIIEGTIIPSTSGTLSLYFASSSTSYTATVKAYSFNKIIKIA